MRWRHLLILPTVVHVASGSESATAKLLARKALEGKKIRVTFGVTENPYLYKDNASWTGVLPDFLEQLRREVGFVWEEIDVSHESTAIVGPNRNTGCARDVSLNLTDLCVGNSWVTNQRLGFAKMLPTLWQESLEMVTSKLEDTRFISRVLEAFRPFDGYLWLAIGLAIALYAAFAWYVEHKDNNRDFPDKSKMGSGLTSCYHGLFGFLWSEPPSRPVTAEGRVLIVGFGFFTLIMLSSYTASLANVLISDNAEPEFDNVAAVLEDSNNKVCMWDSVLNRTAKLLPPLRNQYLNMESYEHGYAMMDRGDCKVLLIDALFHAKMQSDTGNKHCSKVTQGGPILDISCAWPAADWLVGPMSLFITQLVDRGTLDELRQKYSPRVACTDQNEEVQGLDIDKVSGVFFIMGAFLVAASVVHFCKRGVRQSKRAGSLQRISSSVLKRTTLASSASSTESPAGKEVSERATAATPSEARRTSGGARVSNRSDGSDLSVDPEDPGHAMVLAYREEKRLREMPFEKALLVIGDAQARANQEIIEAMQELKLPQSEDFEVADSLPEAVAAKLHESRVPRPPHIQRSAARNR